MSTTKKSPAKANNKATTKEVAKVQPSAIAQKMSSTKVDEILNPSASARIQKLENFQILAGKHRFLTDKRNELEKFIISSDGTKEKVILENAEGFKFTVSNSQVVEKVLAVMEEELGKFIAKSEREVLTFSI